MCNICKKFGSHIKELRVKQNLTQKEFAEKCGLHKNYIGMVERGERNPSLKNISIMAHGLNISLHELMKF